MLRNLLPQIFIPILAVVFLWMFLNFPNFLWAFPNFISRFHPASCGGSFKETWAIPYLSKTHILSWWSWWESHPCLKSYWTTSLSPYGEMRFGYIYNAGNKRTMQLSLYFDSKNFEPANFSRIVIAVLVCAISFHRNNLHITFLPQSLCLGELPLVYAHEASTIPEPPYLYPENA